MKIDKSVLDLHEENEHFTNSLITVWWGSLWRTDYRWALAQIGEILYDEINLQQLDSKMMYAWPPKEGRYTTKGTSWWTKLCSDEAMQHWCQDGI